MKKTEISGMQIVRFFLPSKQIVICCLIVCFTTMAQSLFARPNADIQDIQIVKISPRDQRAVVKLHKKKLILIKVGDTLEGLGTIEEIADGRIVIKKSTDSDSEIIIIRFVNGKQWVEEIRKLGDEKAVLYAPKSTSSSIQAVEQPQVNQPNP